MTFTYITYCVMTPRVVRAGGPQEHPRNGDLRMGLLVLCH